MQHTKNFIFPRKLNGNDHFFFASLHVVQKMLIKGYKLNSQPEMTYRN